MLQTLSQHVDSGVRLLVNGNPLLAYEHFTEGSRQAEGLDIRYEIGRSFGVEQLQTEKDLVEISRTLATTCWTPREGNSLEIGGWTGFNADGTMMGFPFEVRPDLYSPELVARFYHEADVLATEEWTHMLQNKSGGPLAGQENAEVDVAAFLTDRGVHLSAEFLTRYSVRLDWCEEYFPERRDELASFIDTYGTPPY